MIMICEAVEWAMVYALAKKLDVADIKMLIWMSGVRKMDIRKYTTRGATNVWQLSKNTRKRKFKGYRHATRT